MIVDPKETNDVTITVALKGGRVFTGKDVPRKPFGDHDNIVSFWMDGALVVYAMKDVDHAELIFGE